MGEMIVIDIETTGQVPWEHSILSIGAVDFNNPGNQFYMECTARRGAKIDQRALEINGFTMDEITSGKKESMEHMLREFVAWAGKVSDMTLAGHNHYMDVYFLEYSLNLFGIESPFRYRLVDTHTLVYAHMLSRNLDIPLDRNGSGINSEVFLKYCGLPKEPVPHNGLAGAKIEAEALSRLMFGKGIISEYKEFAIPEYLER
ncbi:MAG: 3'-5' exonuclease [Candidatus Micrarchaeota archaeon]|nr:3'-5' exonuclease [Candidatus Micrarchaeota archaeon]